MAPPGFERAGTKSGLTWPTAIVVTTVLLLVAASIVATSRLGHHDPAVYRPAGNTTTTLAGETTRQIAKDLIPAVVDINTINQTDTGYVLSAATGMIISSNGLILTNNHVVEEATSIKVSIAGRAAPYRASFVGADPLDDVAVIKVSGLSGLPTVSLGSSSGLAIGEHVIAIGNALGRGGRPAVTVGHVVYLGRSISASDEIMSEPEHLTGLIETNATIRPGNSGGPLLDDHGRVIGMNTAADHSGNPSFAIPVDRVLAIIGAIERGQSGHGIVLGLRAFLGVVGQPPANGVAPNGVLITRIVLGDPGAKAGIKPGDTIVGFDGRPTPTVGVLEHLVLEHKPGQRASVTFEGPSGKRTELIRLVKGPAP
jgi:S1-C subfamily serine protease